MPNAEPKSPELPVAALADAEFCRRHGVSSPLPPTTVDADGVERRADGRTLDEVERGITFPVRSTTKA